MEHTCQLEKRLSPGSKLFVFSLIFGLVIYPPALFLAQQGHKAAFQYFAGDAFYYLSVARHSVRAPFYTFDGQFPTNGFHPLWQYGLTLIFGSMKLTDPGTQILVAFWLSIFFVAVGTALFGITLLKVTPSIILALIATVPGIYYLLFAIVEPQYANPWAFANGMESPLSILLFGILAYLLIELEWLVEPSKFKLAFLSFWLTLITLSRLDDIFFFLPFLAFVLIFSKTTQEKLTHALIASVIPTLVIGSYLLYNLSYAGLVLPISGFIKGEHSVVVNLVMLIAAFFPGGQFGQVWVSTWGLMTWRALQLYLPMLLALFWLGAWLRPGQLSRDFWSQHYIEKIALSFCIYVLLKGGYNALNVGLLNQGHWYFPLNLMIFNMLAAMLVARTIKLNQISPRISLYLGIAAFLFILLIANAFTNTKRATNYNAGYFEFWQQRQRITAKLTRLSAGGGIIEFDDGIISYSLDLPAMSGLGFVLDKEAYEAKKRGQLLPLAYTRGFNLIASLTYLAAIPAEADTDPELLRKELAGTEFFSAENLNKWNFSVVYRDPGSRTVFIRFEPIESLP